ncbi:MAG: DNRLRE domain-containing protein [Actinomycetota bacterium]
MRRMRFGLCALPMAFVLLAAGIQAVRAEGDSSPPPSPSSRVELTGERTASSKIYAEPDGSLTAEIFANPIQYEDSQGKFVEIDDNLTKRPGGQWTNEAGPLDVDFSSTGSADDLVEIADGNLAVSFGVQGANQVTPSVVDNTITYEEIIPDADVVLSVKGHTLKEDVILSEPPELTGDRYVVRFLLHTEGLTPIKRTTDIVFVGDSGDEVFRMPNLYMLDSSVDPHSGQPAISEDIEVDITGSGSQWVLTARASGKWLTDPARVYPVTIDPTITDQTPSRDTFVQSNITSTPQDTSTELKVGTFDGTVKARSLMKMDLGAIPHGSTINSGELSLFNNHSWSCQARRVEVYRITEGWGANVTWPNRPGFAANPADSINAAKGYSPSCPGGRLNFDVRSVVSYWKNSDAVNHGFGIRAENESDVYGWKIFASDEAGHRPQLTVNYNPPNSPPQAPIDVSMEDGTTSPVLHGIYADPDGDAGRIFYSIYDLDGQPVIVDAAGTSSSSGTDSVYTVSSGLLQEGETYLWDARAFDGSAYSDAIEEQLTLETTTDPDPLFEGDALLWHDSGSSDSGGGEQQMIGGSQNPWGCVIKSHKPHQSTVFPGNGYIQAKSDIICSELPPSNVRTIRQWLYRSSWRGWISVRHSKTSECPAGTPDGTGKPDCTNYAGDRIMRAFINWACVTNTEYVYKVVSVGKLTVDGTVYKNKHSNTSKTESNPDGHIKCKPKD